MFFISKNFQCLLACPYCEKSLSTSKAVKQHISALQSCSKSWEIDQLAKIPIKSKKHQQKSPSPLPLPSDIDHICNEKIDNLSMSSFFHMTIELANMRAPSPAVDQPANKQAWVEDAEDDDDQPRSHTHYSKAYPHSARQPFCKVKTQFESFVIMIVPQGGSPGSHFQAKRSGS